MTDAEQALTDAVKTLAEVMMSSGQVSERYLASMFTQQRDGYLTKQLPEAAAVMQMLATFCADPARREHRKQVRQLLGETPQGSA